MSGKGGTSIQTTSASLNLHASCVAMDELSGLLILGASGSGKSTLALQLMAYGASLVSDDRTIIQPAPEGSGLIATAPEAISGMIEARGVGLLSAKPYASCRLLAAVDMNQTETERLPPHREKGLFEVSIPLFHKVDGPQFAPALIQWLKGGRCA